MLYMRVCDKHAFSEPIGFYRFLESEDNIARDERKPCR